jgi:hypothetical protein
MLEKQIRRLLEDYKKHGYDSAYLPAYHVQRLKISAKDLPEAQRLNKVEKYFSARKFLVILPSVFAFLFLLTLTIESYELFRHGLTGLGIAYVTPEYPDHAARPGVAKVRGDWDSLGGAP